MLYGINSSNHCAPLHPSGLRLPGVFPSFPLKNSCWPIRWLSRFAWFMGSWNPWRRRRRRPRWSWRPWGPRRLRFQYLQNFKALSTWHEKSLREAWESHKRMGSPGPLSHEILRLLSGYVDKAKIQTNNRKWSLEYGPDLNQLLHKITHRICNDWLFRLDRIFWYAWLHLIGWLLISYGTFDFHTYFVVIVVFNEMNAFLSA